MTAEQLTKVFSSANFSLISPVEIKYLILRARKALDEPKDLSPWILCLEAVQVPKDDDALWTAYLEKNKIFQAKELRKILDPILQVLVEDQPEQIIESTPPLFKVDAALISILESLGGEGIDRAQRWKEEAAERTQVVLRWKEKAGQMTVDTDESELRQLIRTLFISSQWTGKNDPLWPYRPKEDIDLDYPAESIISFIDEITLGDKEPATCTAFRKVAGVLWLTRWRKEAERIDLRAHRKAIAPAIATEHYRNALAPLEMTRKVQGNVEDGIAFLNTRKKGDAQNVGFIPPIPALPDQAIEGLRRLAEREEWLPVLVERLVLHFARRCWKAFQTGEVDARVLVYSGGWSGLAEAAGIQAKHRTHIPDVISTLQSWRGKDGKQPAMVADVWTRVAGPGQQAEIRVLVGEGLVPGYAANLAKGPGRRLLPILDVPTLEIPGVGKDRAGELLRYRWELLVELREVAASEVGGISEEGGILLPLKLRRLAAHRANLEEVEAMAIDKVWIGNGPSAWLKPCGQDRVTLLDPSATELLRNGGKQAEGRRVAGLSRNTRER